MNKTESTKISKFLSFVLRHKPDAIGLLLDEYGWADIQELIKKINDSGELDFLGYEQLEEVVLSSDKKRFIISADGLRIRANQGHSIQVDLQLKEVTPPEMLYHGTARQFLDSIRQEGLKSGERCHVHLSTNMETALSVGQRYGKPVILKIKALQMFQQGFKFFLSENGVWLVDQVPVEFIEENQL